jgi:hypothetical protein
MYGNPAKRTCKRTRIALPVSVDHQQESIVSGKSEYRYCHTHRIFAYPFRSCFAHVQVKADGLRQNKGRLKMKTNLTRTLILAAVSLTGAASVHAQDKVAADVPFAFRAAGVEFDAGAYYISQSGHTGVLMLLNEASGSTKLVTTAAPGDDSKHASPKLVFRCGNQSGCALSAVSLANGRTWEIRTPHLKPSELERIAVVYFDRKAE